MTTQISGDTGVSQCQPNSVSQGDLIASDFSGTYTPTLTGIANTTVFSVVGPFQYMRVGNVVTVSGAVNVTATAPGIFNLQITLPIASNLPDSYTCCGAGGSINSAENINGVAVIGDGATNTARMLHFAAGTASNQYSLTFTYLVTP